MNGEIIKWSLMASSVIIIVLLLRQVLKGRIKKSWQYALWMVVLVRLLIPQLPASSLSLFNLITFTGNEKISGVGQEITPKDTQNISLYTEGELETQQDLQIQGDEQQGIGNTEGKNTLLTELTQTTNSFIKKLKDADIDLWLIGCIGLGIYYLYGYHRVKKRLNQLEVVQEESLQQCLSSCKQKLGLQKKMTLVYHNTPMIFGVLKPIVSIPRNYDIKEQEMMLLHELMHYKYKDNMITYIQLLVLVLHWFNPLVWFAMHLMKVDMELSCDERILLLGTSKKQYAQTLVKVMSSTRLEACFVQGMGDSSKQIKNRVLQITHFKRPRLWSSIMAAVLVTVLMVGCLTNPNVKPDLKPDLKPGQNTMKEQSAQDITRNQYKELKIKNIALLGVDQSNLRVDSIMVMSLNDTTGITTVISIPRDIEVAWDSDQKALLTKPGVNPPAYTKINEMLAYGKKENIRALLLKEIEELLDLKINNYVLVDFKGAEAFIDSLGGIEIEVPQDMRYIDSAQNLNIDLKQGYQLLSGKQTLDLIRFRRYQTGDLQRIMVGQSVMKAILEKSLKISTLKEFTQMAQSLIQMVDTDATINYLDIYFSMLQKTDINQLHSFVLPGESQYKANGSFFIVDEEAKKELIKEMKITLTGKL